MSDKIIDFCKDFLEAEEEYMVPVKKLWLIMSEELNDEKIEPDELTKLLKENDLFKVYEDLDKQEQSWPEEEELEMEKLGHFKGPRVMLKSRTPSKDEVAQVLQKKMQNMLDNLKKAYDVRPDDLSDEEEKQLLEAMQKSKELQENIGKAFEKSDLEADEKVIE